ncbi:MAG: hypothetical protein RL104_609, partial [Bacteroidota bacterium]
SAERDEPAPVEEGPSAPTEAPEDAVEVGMTVEWSDLAQAPTAADGESEPEVDFGTEDDGQITLNF